MELQKMYPPQKDSPSTYIAGDIGPDDTYILVGSAEILPQIVPFPLTLGFDRSVTETVIVTDLGGGTNQLTVIRSAQPFTWIAGTKCGRVFTSGDLTTIQTNIETIGEQVKETTTDISEMKPVVADHTTAIADNKAAIEAEVNRATNALTAENTRATTEENRLNTALLAEVERAIAKENALQNSKVNRSELTVLITDAQYTADATTAIVTFTTYDANAQAVGEFVRYLPIASDAAMGLMTPESYAEITRLRTDVKTLQQQGGRFIGDSFNTKAALDAYVVSLTVNKGDFTYVLKDETHSNATTRYIFNGTKFDFAYVIEFEPIGIATPDTLGLVLSDSGVTGGKIFVETDGSMSVIGWDSVLQSIADKISANNSKITIQLNDIEIDSFTLNQATNKTINLNVAQGDIEQLELILNALVSEGIGYQDLHDSDEDYIYDSSGNKIQSRLVFATK